MPWPIIHFEVHSFSQGRSKLHAISHRLNLFTEGEKNRTNLSILQSRSFCSSGKSLWKEMGLHTGKRWRSCSLSENMQHSKCRLILLSNLFNLSWGMFSSLLEEVHLSMYSYQTILRKKIKFVILCSAFAM